MSTAVETTPVEYTYLGPVPKQRNMTYAHAYSTLGERAVAGWPVISYETHDRQGNLRTVVAQVGLTGVWAIYDFPA